MRAGQAAPGHGQGVSSIWPAKPRDPQMRFLKGVIEQDIRQAPGRHRHLHPADQDYPELPEPYNNVAVLYAGQSQFDKARAALEMAIRTNPSYATAHENLGDVYARWPARPTPRHCNWTAAIPLCQPKLALIRDLFAREGPRACSPPHHQLRLPRPPQR
jgi:tetratricopeptide (TPR) repeat protein